MMVRLLVLLLTLVSMLLTGATADRRPLPPRVASGDTTSTAAIVWGETDETAAMEVEYGRDPTFSHSIHVQGPLVNEVSDFSGAVELQGLWRATQYFYRVSFRPPGAGHMATSSATGTFRTAPLPTVPASARFIFSGDLGGQGYCRDATEGYRIFAAMLDRGPDFFVENGDFIYADGTCPVEGPAGRRNVPGIFTSISDARMDWTDRTSVKTVYRQHWRYQWEDGHLSQFLRAVPLYAQWDDHEVINDAGWAWDYWNADAQAAGL